MDAIFGNLDLWREGITFTLLVFFFGGLIALGLGTITGGVMGYFFPALPWYSGVLIGLVCAVAAVLIQELYRREPRPRGWWPGIAAGVAPVLVAGALVYIAGRLLVG